MISSILQKEWIKLKNYLYLLAMISVVYFIYFAYDLGFTFSTIEPNSMMWYRFAYLGQKPYFVFGYIFMGLGALISLAQFLPERIKNRIKIVAHLPISMNRSLLLHVFIGLGFFICLSLLLAVLIGGLIYYLYTPEIFWVMVKDLSFYTLGGVFSYLIVSFAVIERDSKISFIKLLGGLMLLFAFLKERYFLSDSLWLIFAPILFFAVLDGFYSIKQQRLAVKPAVLLSLIFVILVSMQLYDRYTEKYQKSFTRYYLFFSPILKNFVYQKNFGDHSFEYGVKNSSTFGQKEYESYLPFVYWRDLDIQKKLPIKINGESFDKSIIKNSRLSFSYKPSYLKDKEISAYPFFNPQSDLGMIKFPESMLQIGSNGFKIYNFHDGLDLGMTKTLNKLTNSHDVSFPLKHIWGKATNMKPYDKGYLILDSKDDLYNLTRSDSKMKIKQIEYPQDSKIAYISISENKQKTLLGYMIDKNSNLYLMDWDFGFKKIDLKDFDHTLMRVQVISDAKYYTFRYDDSQNYYAAAFDKKLQKIKSVKLAYDYNENDYH